MKAGNKNRARAQGCFGTPAALWYTDGVLLQVTPIHFQSPRGALLLCLGL